MYSSPGITSPKVKLPSTRPNKKTNFSKNKTNTFVVKNGLEKKRKTKSIYLTTVKLNSGVSLTTNNTLFPDLTRVAPQVAHS